MTENEVTYNEILTTQARNNEFSGTVLIQQGTSPIFKQAYGYANRSWNIPNQTDTRFRIASVSKMFTAVAILQLIEQGQLNFDTRIRDALGLADTQIPPVATVYHLLTMTSGIADWFDESGDWQENWEKLRRQQPLYLLRKNEDYLPLFVHKEPLAGVGDKHDYNNAGYILLGLLIERLSQEPYPAFIQKHIFQKAGMADSDFTAIDDTAERVAEGYLPIRDAENVIIDWKRNIYHVTPEAAADGGATSTVNDLCRFSQSLRNNVLLSPAMTAEILAPKVLESEERYRGYTWMYGYANFFLLDDADQIVRYGHTGEEDGVSCRLYYYPQQNLDVIILGNQSWCAGDLGWKIHDLIVMESE